MLRIQLAQLPPAGSVLAGATLGDNHAAEITRLATTQGKPALSVVLDFAGVESITASYLKAVFKVFVADWNSPVQLYPLVANVGSADLRYELESYLSGKDRALQEVSLVGDNVIPVTMVGRLESSAADAYQQLNAVGPTSAAGLHERNPEKASNQTAWNNRLTKLFELRLAHRERVGRNWIYHSALKI